LEQTVFTITAAIEADEVTYDAVTDGRFPLISNDTTMTGVQILGAYHYQPNLERRNHLLKGRTSLGFGCVSVPKAVLT